MNFDRRTLLRLSALLGVSLALRDPLQAAPPPPAEAAATLSVLADTIIPPTDTPGAVAAGVVPFMLRMVADWFTPQENGQFWDGYARFEADTKQRYGRAFSQLAEADRIALLEQAFAEPSARPYFLELVRRLTVFGYYTSEIGATQELEYNMGGDYIPDTAVDPAARAPALARRFHTFSMISPERP